MHDRLASRPTWADKVDPIVIPRCATTARRIDALELVAGLLTSSHRGRRSRLRPRALAGAHFRDRLGRGSPTEDHGAADAAPPPPAPEGASFLTELHHGSQEEGGRARRARAAGPRSPRSRRRCHDRHRSLGDHRRRSALHRAGVPLPARDPPAAAPRARQARGLHRRRAPPGLAPRAHRRRRQPPPRSVLRGGRRRRGHDQRAARVAARAPDFVPGVPGSLGLAPHSPNSPRTRVDAIRGEKGPARANAWH